MNDNLIILSYYLHRKTCNINNSAIIAINIKNEYPADISKISTLLPFQPK